VQTVPQCVGCFTLCPEEDEIYWRLTFEVLKALMPELELKVTILMTDLSNSGNTSYNTYSTTSHNPSSSKNTALCTYTLFESLYIYRPTRSISSTQVSPPQGFISCSDQCPGSCFRAACTFTSLVHLGITLFEFDCPIVLQCSSTMLQSEREVNRARDE
jgi:hypothetical protein